MHEATNLMAKECCTTDRTKNSTGWVCWGMVWKEYHQVAINISVSFHFSHQIKNMKEINCV